MRKDTLREIITFSTLLFILLALFWLTGCSKNTNTVTGPDNQADNQTYQSAMQKLLDDDEEFSSFEPNYNEQGLMNLALGKVNTAIYPLKVEQRVVPVSKNLNVEFVGDTAYGLSTVIYSGTLFIQASYNPIISKDSVIADTVVTKNFTSTITRKVMFIKKIHGNSSKENWKIAAISLPEGGTVTDNVIIKQLTVILPSDSMIVTSPNEYFLYRNFAHKKQTPSISRGEQVKIRIEVISAYSDTDYVSITYGADKKTFSQSKKILKLVSSNANGSFYEKVYEGSWNVNYLTGHTHTVVNVVPGRVTYQDNTPVECKTWGFPYKIN